MNLEKQNTKKPFSIQTSIYTTIILICVYIFIEVFFDKSILNAFHDSLISLVNGIGTLTRTINKFFSDLVQFRETIEMLKNQAQLQEQLDNLLKVKSQESIFHRGFHAFLSMLSNLCGRFLWFSAQVGNSLISGIDVLGNWVTYTGDFIYEKTPSTMYQVFKVFRTFLILACFCTIFHGIARIPLISTRIPFLLQLDQIVLQPVFAKTYTFLKWLKSPTTESFLSTKSSLIEAVKNAVESHSNKIIQPLTESILGLTKSTKDLIKSNTNQLGNLGKIVGNVDLQVQSSSVVMNAHLLSILSLLSGATISATMLSKNSETILMLKDVIFQFCNILQIPSQETLQNPQILQDQLSPLIELTREKLDLINIRVENCASPEDVRKIENCQTQVTENLDEIHQLKEILGDTYEKFMYQVNLQNQSFAASATNMGAQSSELANIHGLQQPSYTLVELDENKESIP